MNIKINRCLTLRDISTIELDEDEVGDIGEWITVSGKSKSMICRVRYCTIINARMASAACDYVQCEDEISVSSLTATRTPPPLEYLSIIAANPKEHSVLCKLQKTLRVILHNRCIDVAQPFPFLLCNKLFIVTVASSAAVNKKSHTVGIITCSTLVDIQESEDISEPTSLSTTIGEQLKSEIPGVSQTNLDVIQTCLSSKNSFLIEGESGSGKTFTAHKIANAASNDNNEKTIKYKTHHVTELFRRLAGYGGKAAAAIALKRLFKETNESSTNILILEGVDLIQTTDDVSRIMLMELSSLLQESSCRVIGTCVSWKNVHELLIGGGRFDNILSLVAPDLTQRVQILRHYNKNTDDDSLLRTARGLPGATPADLSQAQIAIAVDEESNLPAVSKLDWPASYFSDLVGIDTILNKLNRAVFNPLRLQEKQSGRMLVSGILFHGPTGSGKTNIADVLGKTLTSSSSAGYLQIFSKIECNSTSIISKVVGESERNITKLFDSARRSSPCILIIDQFEALAYRRREADGSSTFINKAVDRTLSTLLTEMDGASLGSSTSQVLVVACTSRKQDLDPAVLRSGRLDLHIEMPSPTSDSLYSILKRIIPFTTSDDVNVDEIITRLSKSKIDSHATATAILSAAKMSAIRRSISAGTTLSSELLPTVTHTDIEVAAVELGVAIEPV